MIDLQRGEHLTLMREFTRGKRDGDLADQLVRDYALPHLEADLRWLDTAEARMGQLVNNGGQE